MIISGMANQLRHRFSRPRHHSTQPPRLRTPGPDRVALRPLDGPRRQRLPTGAKDMDPFYQGLQLTRHQAFHRRYATLP